MDNDFGCICWHYATYITYLEMYYTSALSILRNKQNLQLQLKDHMTQCCPISEILLHIKEKIIRFRVLRPYLYICACVCVCTWERCIYYIHSISINEKIPTWKRFQVQFLQGCHEVLHLKDLFSYFLGWHCIKSCKSYCYSCEISFNVSKLAWQAGKRGHMVAHPTEYKVCHRLGKFGNHCLSSY